MYYMYLYVICINNNCSYNYIIFLNCIAVNISSQKQKGHLSLRLLSLNMESKCYHNVNRLDSARCLKHQLINKNLNAIQVRFMKSFLKETITRSYIDGKMKLVIIILLIFNMLHLKNPTTLIISLVHFG